jgi:deoxyribose-phosphate aldolase
MSGSDFSNFNRNRGGFAAPPSAAAAERASTATTPAQLDDIIEQITEAVTASVRSQLLDQGLPLPSARVPAAENPTWQSLLNQGAARIAPAAAPAPANLDASLAKLIDHTLLKPDATPEEIKKVCAEAAQYKFATVCVNSTWVGLAAQLLKGSGVKAIAVVGFPLGAASSAAKAFEAREAVKNGAEEIDMVINIGALKGRDYTLVLEDIRQVVAASQPHPVKVILETSNLNNDEKVIGCALSKAAGAHFVKTSTGFGSAGATAEDIALMRRVVGPEMGVKASGGIRTFEDASKMVAAGATRIGASASVAIVTHAAGQAPATGASKSGPKNY